MICGVSVPLLFEWFNRLHFVIFFNDCFMKPDARYLDDISRQNNQKLCI